MTSDEFLETIRAQISEMKCEGDRRKEVDSTIKKGGGTLALIKEKKMKRKGREGKEKKKREIKRVIQVTI
jgi:hypothetical protein